MSDQPSVTPTTRETLLKVANATKGTLNKILYYQPELREEAENLMIDLPADCTDEELSSQIEARNDFILKHFKQAHVIKRSKIDASNSKAAQDVLKEYDAWMTAIEYPEAPTKEQKAHLAHAEYQGYLLLKLAEVMVTASKAYGEAFDKNLFPTDTTVVEIKLKSAKKIEIPSWKRIELVILATSMLHKAIEKNSMLTVFVDRKSTGNATQDHVPATPVATNVKANKADRFTRGAQNASASGKGKTKKSGKKIEQKRTFVPDETFVNDEAPLYDTTLEAKLRAAGFAPTTA